MSPLVLKDSSSHSNTKRSPVSSENTPDASPGFEFDVFLNFCGKDTRNGIVDVLYMKLEEAGIRTFKDDEKLEKGANIDELLRVIECSKISIPIFSQNYASRVWCLRELVKMVECRNIGTQKILPVFYEINPSVVREQSDNYKEDLLEHKKNSKEEMVEEWRGALKQVGSLNGWVYEKKKHGLGKFVAKVVLEVSKQLKKAKFICMHEFEKTKLTMPDGIIGMNELEEKVMQLLNVKENDVRIVGIHGHTGAGKTLLAKTIYNKIANQFKKCSFVADVREKSQRHGMEYVEKQLLCDILQGNSSNIDDDKSMRRLRKKKFLILLDDVDQKQHVTTVVDKLGWFGLGSRILVTTRNKDILNVPEVYGVVEIVKTGKSPKKLLLNKIVGSDFYEYTERILASLQNDNVPIIGICGTGGVGKTTLALNVHDCLVKDLNTSSGVYWVSLSQSYDITGLQSKIAKIIGVLLSSEDDQICRASELSEALQRMEKFILFLDGVWDCFPLEKIGISDMVRGCRLILISRSLEVCHQMGCSEVFKVSPLSENEAWNLFKQKIGSAAILSPEISKIAWSITKKCAGLPLGITTMGSSLRGVNDIHMWRDTLERLRELSEGHERMITEVFPVLKVSYERLRNEQVQLCFLCCAVYPEDHEIEREDLINLFINTDLIHVADRQKQFDRGHSILNKLQDACLLETTQSSSVKMHDLIRDMAIMISKSSFMVKSGLSLTKLPDMELWMNDLEVVSFMQNHLYEISVPPKHRIWLPLSKRKKEKKKCLRVSTLLLNDNLHLSRISYLFFELFPKLRVLDLSNTGMLELPSSISDLVELTALILSYCRNLKSIPSLSKLSELRALNLAYTAIEQLPKGMKKMLSLRYLNLCCENLKMLPVGILPNLSSLRQFEIIWPLRNPCKELSSLKRLEIFVVHCQCLDDYDSMTKHLQMADGYHISVSKDVDSFKYFLEAQKGIYKSVAVDWSVFPAGSSGYFPRDTQSLMLSGKLSGNNKDNSVIPFLIESSPPAQCSKHHYHGTPESNFFYHLKRLSVINVGHAKALLQPSFLRELQNLEELTVLKCRSFQEIVATDDEDRDHCIISLQKLKKLQLKSLPDLERISNKMLVCDLLEEIEIIACPQLEKIPLFMRSVGGELLPPPSLWRITIGDATYEGAIQWWESLNWDNHNAREALQHLLRIDVISGLSISDTADGLGGDVGNRGVWIDLVMILKRVLSILKRIYARVTRIRFNDLQSRSWRNGGRHYYFFHFLILFLILFPLFDIFGMIWVFASTIFDLCKILLQT